MPPVDWMIGGAGLLMIPKRPDHQSVWLHDVFGDYIGTHYEQAAESNYWTLYRRKTK